MSNLPEKCSHFVFVDDACARKSLCLRRNNFDCTLNENLLQVILKILQVRNYINIAFSFFSFSFFFFFFFFLHFLL